MAAPPGLPRPAAPGFCRPVSGLVAGVSPRRAAFPDPNRIQWRRSAPPGSADPVPPTVAGAAPAWRRASFAHRLPDYPLARDGRRAPAGCQYPKATRCPGQMRALGTRRSAPPRQEARPCGTGRCARCGVKKTLNNPRASLHATMALWQGGDRSEWPSPFTRRPTPYRAPRGRTRIVQPFLKGSPGSAGGRRG